MFSKIIKILGAVFLVILILLAIFIVFITLNTSNHKELARPYLEKNIPIIASWDFQKMNGLLSPEFQKAARTECAQKIFNVFTKLGKLKSFEEPQFLSSRSVVSSAATYEVVSFRTIGHFEAGDAVLTLVLITQDDTYLIRSIKVNSDVLIQ